jgi:hypothetical protein
MKLARMNGFTDARTETGNENLPIPPVFGLSFLKMKFRVKFEKIQWGVPAVAALNIAPYLGGRHVFAAYGAVIASCWILLMVLYVFAWRFPGLELDSGYLRKRGLLKTTKVSLAEITRVKNLGFSTDRVQIDFRPPNSFVETKSIVVNPADRTDFVTALRQFAPRAMYE